MDTHSPGPEPETALPDMQALLLMLSYVEAECRRLGATESAHLTARAARVLVADAAPPGPPQQPEPGKPRNLRVHRELQRSSRRSRNRPCSPNRLARRGKRRQGARKPFSSAASQRSTR